jgi:hypothetical protein
MIEEEPKCFVGFVCAVMFLVYLKVDHKCKKLF